MFSSGNYTPSREEKPLIAQASPSLTDSFDYSGGVAEIEAGSDYGAWGAGSFWQPNGIQLETAPASSPSFNSSSFLPVSSPSPSSATTTVPNLITGAPVSVEANQAMVDEANAILSGFDPSGSLNMALPPHQEGGSESFSKKDSAPAPRSPAPPSSSQDVAVRALSTDRDDALTLQTQRLNKASDFIAQELAQPDDRRNLATLTQQTTYLMQLHQEAYGLLSKDASPELEQAMGKAQGILSDARSMFVTWQESGTSANLSDDHHTGTMVNFAAKIGTEHDGFNLDPKAVAQGNAIRAYLNGAEILNEETIRQKGGVLAALQNTAETAQIALKETLMSYPAMVPLAGHVIAKGVESVKVMADPSLLRGTWQEYKADLNTAWESNEGNALSIIGQNALATAGNALGNPIKTKRQSDADHAFIEMAGFDNPVAEQLIVSGQRVKPGAAYAGIAAELFDADLLPIMPGARVLNTITVDPDPSTIIRALQPRNTTLSTALRTADINQPPSLGQQAQGAWEGVVNMEAPVHSSYDLLAEQYVDASINPQPDGIVSWTKEPFDMVMQSSDPVDPIELYDILETKRQLSDAAQSLKALNRHVDETTHMMSAMLNMGPEDSDHTFHLLNKSHGHNMSIYGDLEDLTLRQLQAIDQSKLSSYERSQLNRMIRDLTY